MHAFSILTSLDIDECKTDDLRVKKFKIFLKNHPDQMFLQIDKGPNLIFLDKKTYFDKLNDLLDDQFETYLTMMALHSKKILILIENYSNKHLRDVCRLIKSHLYIQKAH